MSIREEVLSGETDFDGSCISLDRLIDLPESQIASLSIDSSGGRLRLDELFSIAIDTTCEASPWQNRLSLHGDFSRFENLCSSTSSGLTTIRGNVGDRFCRSQRGGVILVDGSAGSHALVDKRDGLCVIRGDVWDCFGSPVPGKLQGIQGGDTILLGNLGSRACQRMRRGVVYVAGHIGDHLAHQWIAGTILARQSIGPHWAANMRRGSLILDSAPTTTTGATLSSARLLELSFLPILWNHLRSQLALVAQVTGISPEFRLKISQAIETIPTGRRALRRVGDLECEGQGEVLMIQK